jgi:hypothetical protein
MSFREYVTEVELKKGQMVLNEPDQDQHSGISAIGDMLKKANVAHKSVYGKLSGNGWSIYKNKASKKPEAITFAITNPKMSFRKQSAIQVALNAKNYMNVANMIKSFNWDEK